MSRQVDTPELRPHISELLCNPEALLLRTDLQSLGLTRKAVDAVFRALPVVHIPGYTRPMIRVGDYLRFTSEHTYSRDDDRVRP